MQLSEVWVYAGSPPSTPVSTQDPEAMRSLMDELIETPITTLNTALPKTLEASPWRTCGDGTCDRAFEDDRNCYSDCGCGDNYCDRNGDRGRQYQYYGVSFPAETTESCPQDCACGDGVCRADHGENPSTCQADCHCGDDRCDSGCSDWHWLRYMGRVSPYRVNGVIPERWGYCNEDPVSCARDCHCGDGVCDESWGEFPDGHRAGVRVYSSCRETVSAAMVFARLRRTG